MPRMARLVVPGYPHHVTQRGSRKQPTFFCDDDFRDYLSILGSQLRRAATEIWAYCLMPNHVHLVAVPTRDDSLANLFRTAHSLYAARINSRHGWQGHLWQERFHSFVMDETHLLATVRYVEMNPVRAGMCRRPQDWPWSSVHAHLTNRNDPMVSRTPILSRISDWAAFLGAPPAGPTNDDLRRHTRSGRPGGHPYFILELEALSGRRLHKRRPGPKPKPKSK